MDRRSFLLAPLAAKLAAQSPDARWTENQAWTWYKKQPWLVGCNYAPAYAINQLEMWQADTFDPKAIDRELKLAAGIGEPLVGLNAKAGYMFQSESLMPWRSAIDNVTAGLQFRGMDAGSARAKGEAWLERVGLNGFDNRYPHEMSGGMRKRCALAQMLILDPKIMLMDEPFSALDIQTRQLMENELLQLWEEDKKSVIFITHDLEEAISLSDRVIVLAAGPATHPIGEFVIDLPRPRDVAEIRMTPRFLELHAQIWHVMKEEVLKGYAQTKNKVMV